MIKSSNIITSMTKVRIPTSLLPNNDKVLYIKRDDQYKLHSDIDINGNKIRKFLKLHEKLSSSSLKEVMSCGGIQSNSMLAIAAITNYHKCRFTYYTKKVNDLERYKNKGNYAAAMKYGMNHVELSNAEYDDVVNMHKEVDDNLIHWVPQGGAYKDAYKGVQELIKELVDFTNQQDKKYKWKLLIASGTGTTALYAARALHLIPKQSDLEVVALPCVGSKEYLKEQMTELDNNTGSYGIFPTILPTSSKRVFGKPIKDHYLIWSELLQYTGIKFDLIYAPRAFELLLEALNNDKGYWNNDVQIVYYHCGGVEGNETQLDRYRYSKLI
jgi:1-aminocyclopropane-1-carboxylate deaminase/D-cysteine desulfhydrase-like pyridoxal-dependent ACC family enzyme